MQGPQTMKLKHWVASSQPEQTPCCHSFIRMPGGGPAHVTEAAGLTSGWRADCPTGCPPVACFAGTRGAPGGAPDGAPGGAGARAGTAFLASSGAGAAAAAAAGAGAGAGAGAPPECFNFFLPSHRICSHTPRVGAKKLLPREAAP